MKTNAGWQMHSNIPSRVRTITNPVKFVHAAVQAKIAPQAVMLVEARINMAKL